MKFFCIADEDTVRGFRLAGVEGRVVSGVTETGRALDDALRFPDCAIVLITYPAADAIRDKVETIRLERDCPLIVEIPGPEGQPAGLRSLRKFVQEAVGIRLGQSEGP
jgi:V/A-type H+/Na+-transporting ATPase subunit F